MSRLCTAFLLFTMMLTTPANAQSPPQAASPPARSATMPDPWPGMKKLLVIADVQSGFHHDSINHAMAVIEQLGRKSNSYATILRTDSQLITKQPLQGTGARYAGRPINARNLDFFDAIFFLGSGAGTLNDEQKSALLSFVKDDGKGLIAGHAATVAYFEWPQFTNLIGGFMEYEFQPTMLPIIVDDSAFPGASAFAGVSEYRDQFPIMKAPFSSRDVHVIMRLDPRRLTPEQLARRPDGDMPVVWAKQYGKGRVYNTTLAHLEDVWDDPKFQQMTLEGIRWALGLVNANVANGASQPPSFSPPSATAK